jgi:galactose oxidase-like protein
VAFTRIQVRAQMNTGFARSTGNGIGVLLEALLLFLIAVAGQASLVRAQSGGTFTATGSMTTARTWHTATLLPNGKVLITGGAGSSDPSQSFTFASAELYDPSTGTFTATGDMTTPRLGHTATLLPNGKVLIVGGEVCRTTSCRYLASAELYDPSTGSFTATGNMSTARWGCTVTLLNNGKVLIAGGSSASTFAFYSAELYDPSTGTFTATGSMTVFRAGHSATLLPDGKVLITGSGVGAVPGHELYDPDTGVFHYVGGTIPSGPIGQPRTTATLTLLTNGKVLAMLNDVEGGDPDGAAVYDPATGEFTATGETTVYAYTATLLPDGTALVAGYPNLLPGRSSSADLYDPATSAFFAAGDMATPRYGHTATLLPDGTVLMSGGFPFRAAPVANAEIFHPGVQGTPTVRIVDNDTGSLTTLAVGDSFSFQVTGVPPISVVSVSETGWSGSVGYTDASGLFFLNGIVGSNVIGTWQQTWTIGGVVAQPSPLQFTITPKP